MNSQSNKHEKSQKVRSDEHERRCTSAILCLTKKYWLKFIETTGAHTQYSEDVFFICDDMPTFRFSFLTSSGQLYNGC